MNVDDVMTKDPACCRPEEPLLAAAQRMVEHGVSCLVVVSEPASRRVVGMLGEGDVCRAGAADELSRLRVADAMSEPVLCRAGDLLWEALLLCETHGVRRLPVVDRGGQLLGLITLEDVAREAASDRAGVPALSSREVCRAIAACAGRRRDLRAER